MDVRLCGSAAHETHFNVPLFHLWEYLFYLGSSKIPQGHRVLHCNMQVTWNPPQDDEQYETEMYYLSLLDLVSRADVHKFIDIQQNVTNILIMTVKVKI